MLHSLISCDRLTFTILFHVMIRREMIARRIRYVDTHLGSRYPTKGEQQFQGTLQVTIRNSPSGQPIDDNEVRRKFQQFGDVKAVKPVGDRIE